MVTERRERDCKPADLQDKRVAFTPYKSLPPKGKVFTIAIVVIGILIYLYQIPEVRQQDIGLILVLGIASGLTYLYPVVHPSKSFIFTANTVPDAIALVALGIPGTMLVIFISSIMQIIRQKRFSYLNIYNLFVNSISFFVAGLVYHWAGAAIPSQSSFKTAAMLPCFLTYSFFNPLLAAMAPLLSYGIGFRKSGVINLINIAREFCFMCIGGVTVMIWAIDPYAIVFSLFPIFLIYMTFQLPALKRKSELDPKTGLLNARAFLEAFEVELRRAHKNDWPLALIMADLDHMRNINNTYGHLAGDQVLVEVSRTLKQIFRDLDLIARFGGEEFLIILSEVSQEHVIGIVERARAAIEKLSIEVESSAEPVRVTISFGIAQRQGTAQTTNELINNADMALYRAKENGRNCIGVYKHSEEILVANPFTMPTEQLAETRNQGE